MNHVPELAETLRTIFVNNKFIDPALEQATKHLKHNTRYRQSNKNRKEDQYGLINGFKCKEFEGQYIGQTGPKTKKQNKTLRERT